MSGKSPGLRIQEARRCDGDAECAFHTEARRRLRLLGTALGLPRDGYDLRTTKAGIAGAITLHGDRIYVQVSQAITGNDVGVLFRPLRGAR